MKESVLTITSAKLISPRNFKWIKQKQKINNNDLIVKLIAWGVCSSDVKTFNTEGGKYFGHEMVGKVIYGNEHYSVGTLVVPFHSYIDSKKNLQFNSDLGFNDYLHIPLSKVNSLMKIPTTNAPEKYVFLDSISCVVHALKTAFLYKKSGLDILILGNGFMANLFADILGLSGNNIDFSSRENQVSNERKFDVCIDTTGNNQFINMHIRNVSMRGKLLCFCKPDDSNLDLNQIRFNEIILQYSRFFDDEDVLTAIELISNDHINLDKYMTIYHGKEELEKVFLEFNNKSIIRGIIHLGEELNENISV